MHVGNPKQFVGRWNVAPLGRWRGWPPINSLLPTWHVILPNVVVPGQTVWAYLWVPKIFANAETPFLGTRHGWPPGNTLLPYLCYHANFAQAKVKLCEIHRKFWPVASCLLRSLGVIGTDTDRSATYDFLLVIHRNHGPRSYRFHDKKRWLQYSPSPCI